MASIFTKIIAGELPGHFVWQDERAIAILTIEPINSGHTLVIPKKEVDHWDDVDEDTAAHLMLVSQKIAKAIKASYPCKRIGMSIAGIEVPHTHLHLIPINDLGDLSFAKAKPASQDQLLTVADTLRAALRDLGHGEYVPD